MTSIQKKTLEHSSKLLESLDTYPIHNALINAMIIEKVDNEARTRIANAVQEIVVMEFSKAYMTKEWIDALLSE